MLSSDDRVFDASFPKGAKFDPSHWFVTGLFSNRYFTVSWNTFGFDTPLFVWQSS
jgi:hypothetical protein